MEIYNTQIKNKHIKNMTCPKSVAIEPELYYKITLMYKCCCIEQINAQLTTVPENNETETTTCSKWANTPQ